MSHTDDKQGSKPINSGQTGQLLLRQVLRAYTKHTVWCRLCQASQLQITPSENSLLILTENQRKGGKILCCQSNYTAIQKQLVTL